MTRIFLIFLSLFCWSLLVDAQNYRLPEIITPSHYDVTLDTDLTAFTFSGSVTITIRASQATSTITLHSKDLVLANVRLLGSTITVENHSAVEETDFLVIELNQNLIAGQDYRLAIDFSGVLGTENVGYYRASYPDEEGNTKNLAITHLESTNARRAFPCFDQPNFKATFRLTLIRDLVLRTTANQRLESTIPSPTDDGKVIDTYVVTPIMSTYLVAFSVSDYARDFDPVQITYSVYGRRELIQRGEGKYALTVGIGVINAMQTYTGVDYSFLKMDQVAVPNDFYRIGAMENWGMVTYRERYLMYNEETSTTAEKRTTATIIAHEFAHQWFGDLVTPQWWKYIWLNEGFATYFEMVAADQVEPEWKLMDQFLTSILQPAFNADAFLSTTSMTKEAESPSEIQSLYDTIVYEKAGSVIRMAQAFLGETVFKAGLTKYLTEWSYGNVEPQNLYDSWQEALGNDGVNVAEILGRWETEKGYPVVTITRNYNSRTILLRQTKFLLREPIDNAFIAWPIPLNFMYSIRDDFDFTSTIPDLWFSRSTEITPDLSPESFLIANKGVTGYYRVNYDATNWDNIINFLTEDDFTKIIVVNRAQLLDDAFNLARAGHLDFEIALRLSTYLLRERDYVPLTSFFNAARYLNTVLLSHTEYLQFQAFIEQLLVSIAAELTFGESPTDGQHQKLNRINVWNWLCDTDSAGCRQTSLDTFRQWKNGGTESLTPDSQMYVYCGALRVGDQSDWNFLFEKYQVDESDTHRTRILNALGCSGNTEVLTRLLDMTIDPEAQFFKSADRQTAFASVYSSGRVGLGVALNYVASKYNDINTSTLNLNTIVTGLSSRLSTPQQLAEFTALLQSVSGIVPESTRNAAQKNVEDNVSWSATNVPVISQWLEEYIGVVISTTEGGSETTSSDPETTEGGSETTSSDPETTEGGSETTSSDPGTTEDEVTTTTTIASTTDVVETTTAGGTVAGLSFGLSLICLLVSAALLK